MILEGDRFGNIYIYICIYIYIYISIYLAKLVRTKAVFTINLVMQDLCDLR